LFHKSWVHWLVIRTLLEHVRTKESLFLWDLGIARQLAFVLYEDGCSGEGQNMQNILPMLAKLIIDCKPSNATLNSSFIEVKDISEDARKFRTIFIQVLAQHGMDMSKLNKCILKNEMHLSVTDVIWKE
jgi:hypothetical protein